MSLFLCLPSGPVQRKPPSEEEGIWAILTRKDWKATQKVEGPFWGRVLSAWGHPISRTGGFAGRICFHLLHAHRLCWGVFSELSPRPPCAAQTCPDSQRIPVTWPVSSGFWLVRLSPPTVAFSLPNKLFSCQNSTENLPEDFRVAVQRRGGRWWSPTPLLPAAEAQTRCSPRWFSARGAQRGVSSPALHAGLPRGDSVFVLNIRGSLESLR